jgi:hypothetical protein
VRKRKIFGDFECETKLDLLRFYGGMPGDALSYPWSFIARAGLRGSIKFAVSNTERYDWLGIDKVHLAWLSKVYDDNKWLEDHQGLMLNGRHWYSTHPGGTIKRCKDDTVGRPRVGGFVGRVSVPDLEVPVAKGFAV